MGEFPSVEERLLNSGIPREMAAEIAAEVPRSKDAFSAWSGLVLVSALTTFLLAIILIPFVYLAAVWLWGGIRACGSGMLTSAHAIAWLQWFASMMAAVLIQTLWLRRASHKTRMQYVAAHLLRLYLSGAGTGVMSQVIEKNPEYGTADGFFVCVVRDYRRKSLAAWFLAQGVVVAALFLVPLAC
ncbi:hypothetical protein HPO_10632 [Hyphomonas polymorpha PS728]|uniref:Uncharacterized protein n=1 Tax=Hyphomonas polymorpha PS728 TaxID=1280954 RepID=A0A062VDJ8_9PROT|nr:hypothetical protein [Hyphomonas polymorpha]KCZ98354.1 hypothetical protein HPO_10632 [Hyphomonas polymorpha PS728]